MSSKVTATVGYKFNADGSVRTFPGNTIICSVNPVRHAQVYQACAWGQEQLKQMQCQHKFAFLPLKSMHMTIFQLLTDQVRSPDKWSRFLPIDSTLEETDCFFISKMNEIDQPSGFRMAYKRMRVPIMRNVADIELQPDGVETEQALQDYRNQASEVTGIRFPDHDKYVYHITLAYKVYELAANEQLEVAETFRSLEEEMLQRIGLFETGAPELVFFDDMFNFVQENQRYTLITRPHALS